jgi:hypothetical protein
MQEQAIPLMATDHEAKRERRLAVKYPKRVLLAALCLGWSTDWLFYNKPTGISLLLFVSMLWLVLRWIGRKEGVQPDRRNQWLLIPLFFFATMAFVRANGFITTLNVLAVIALLSYILYFYAAGRVEALEMVGVLLLPMRVVGNSLKRTSPLVSAGIDLNDLRAKGRRNFFPIVRGLLLALPLLLLFIILLASADLIFADFVKEIMSLEILSDLVEGSWRGMLILGVSWLFAGGLVVALERGGEENDASGFEKGLGYLRRTFSLGFVEMTTLLVLVNALFMSFATVQFAYLFGGERNINLEGYTYAEYARRGFFELVAVAVLSLVLILGLNWITRRESKRQIQIFNGLSSLMVWFVLVMLVSAFRRMRLYESTFGYTELRLYGYLFMIWLALLMGWFLVTLWKRPEYFSIGLILAAIGYLATLNLIDPDAFITRQNLERYQETNDLDVSYLTTLSADAVPELIEALAQVGDDPQLVTTPACTSYWRGARLAYGEEINQECQATPAQILQEDLEIRRQEMQTDTDWRLWQAFHLSRWRAHALLSRS